MFLDIFDELPRQNNCQKLWALVLVNPFSKVIAETESACTDRAIHA